MDKHQLEQLERLTNNLRNTVRVALEHTSEHKALVLFDEDSEVSRMLLAAYRTVFTEIHGDKGAGVPGGVAFLDFAKIGPEQALAEMNALAPRDLVVLVQSANFRLNEFRIRVELFKRGLKNIEHSHAGRMVPEQLDAFIDSLAYDASYYRSTGPQIKAQLEAAPWIEVECYGGTKLRYNSPMEEPMLNIGDYTGMENIGGSFPIGEVFTEPKDLTAINGELMVYGYGNTEHQIEIANPPFKAILTDGILSAPDAPPKFQEILAMIRAEETVQMRELGLGLNKATGKHRLMNDVMSFERQYGMHVSLGHKHAIYKKPGFVAKHTKYHMDIFIDVSRITAGDVVIFENGRFTADTSAI